MCSSRPGFSPTQRGIVRGPRQRVRRTQRFRKPRPPSRLRRWGRPPAPQGAESVSPSVRRGRLKQKSTRGRGTRSEKAVAPRGRDAVGSGVRARGLYRPAPRAAAAVPRGSGSCTIVSGPGKGGRFRGGCRALGPASARPCHPWKTLGVVARLRAKLRGSVAVSPRVSPSAPARRP